MPDSSGPPDPATPASMRLRPAAKADVPRLVALETAVFETDRISARSFRDFLASPETATLIVAETGTAGLSENLT